MGFWNHQSAFCADYNRASPPREQCSSFFQGSEGPFYVVDLDTLVQMHQKWLSNLPRVKPFYAVKCNNTPTVLRTLNALGIGFDCASKVLTNIFEKDKVSSHLTNLLT